MPGRADTDLFSGETAAGPVFSIGIIPRQPEKTHKNAFPPFLFRKMAV